MSEEPLGQVAAGSGKAPDPAPRNPPDEPSAAPRAVPEAPPPEVTQPSAPRSGGQVPGEKDDQPYLKRAEEDEREWQRRQLNLGELGEEDIGRAGRDWIGRDANRVTGGSMYSAARDININASARQQVPIRCLARREADQMAAWLVEPLSQSELQAAIEREPLVFLRGRNGTGRRTAGLAALLKWADDTGATGEQPDLLPVGIILPSSAAPRAEPEFRKRHGYVLDIANSDNVADLKDYAERLQQPIERGQCRVAVLVPSDWPDSFGRVVNHIPPSASRVFRARLEYEADQAEIDQHVLDDMLSEIDDDLRQESSPAEAAHLAGFLIAKLKAGHSAAELRVELPQRIRDDVRRRLKEGGPVLGRCFMASAAVFNNLPEPIVSAKAMRLAEHINQVEYAQDEEPPPAWQHLHSWLDYANATTRASAAAGVGPTVHLRRRRAEREILRVLWQEQPAIREPLIAWLRETFEESDPAVSTKAAHAAGILATFDFDAADKKFIIPWSKSRRPRMYRVTAMMLESAVVDPDVAPRVYARLRSLVAGTHGQRLIAAHALGSRIGLDAPDVALSELRTIALSRNPEACRAVAGSIGNLYLSGTAEQIIDELAVWVTSGSLGHRYTSALAFVRLAVITSVAPDRPALNQLEPSHNITGQLALLWRNSLSLKIIARRGASPELAVPESWVLFERWVRRYSEDPSIHSVIDEIFSNDSKPDPIRGSLMLHLRRWKNRKILTSDIYEHLVEMLKAR